MPDCAEVQDDGSVVLHEVKTGVPSWTESLIDACLKDAWSLTDEGKASHNKNISGLHRRFAGLGKEYEPISDVLMWLTGKVYYLRKPNPAKPSAPPTGADLVERFDIAVRRTRS